MLRVLPWLTALLGLLLTGCGGSSDAPAQYQLIQVPPDAPKNIRSTVEELNSSDPKRRARAASLLGETRGDEKFTVPCLLAALSDGNHLVRSRAAESLGELGDRAAIEPLIDLLRRGAQDKDVRSAAAKALGQLEAAEAVATLTAMLADAVWHTRYQAVVALGRIGDPAAREPLAQTVRYEANYFVRTAAVDSLERLAEAAAE